MFLGLNGSGMDPGLARCCRLISRTGDGFLYVILAGWLYLRHGSEDQLLQAMFLAFIVERPVYFVLKNGFKRNRPQQAIKGFHSVITPSDQFSFPSGHTSAAFMVATLVGYFMPALLAPLVIWALLVAFSRVALGVHFSTDTLMGMASGVSTAFLSLNYIL